MSGRRIHVAEVLARRHAEGRCGICGVTVVTLTTMKNSPGAVVRCLHHVGADLDEFVAHRADGLSTEDTIFG